MTDEENKVLPGWPLLHVFCLEAALELTSKVGLSRAFFRSSVQ
jgi:hypothetical protein